MEINVFLRSRTRLFVNLNISLRNSVRYRAFLRNYEYFCIRARTLVFVISRNHAILRKPANKNPSESGRIRAYVSCELPENFRAVNAPECLFRFFAFARLRARLHELCGVWLFSNEYLRVFWVGPLFFLRAY